MERRDVLKLGLLSSALTISNVYGSTEPATKNVTINKITNKKRVIIIGGGFAGLSVAKNIKVNYQDAEVLVFESKNIFASCPYSNLWFGGVEGVNYDNLLFSPLEPAKKYGYRLINDKVVSIDKSKKIITTLNGEFEYSLLVIATGIEYDYSTFGLDEKLAKECQNLYPASYNGGNEQLTLKKKIDNFKEGTFLITVPKGTYRCPPAPYERACLIANYFKSKKLNAKVVLIDSREKPTTKAKGFLKAFNELYKDYIEYLPMSNITNIDTEGRIVYFDTFDSVTKQFVQKKLQFHDANIIPSNTATKLLKESGLEVTKDGWGKVKSPSFESLNDENIFIVGDALGEYPFPKSAQMANSCGIILGEQIAKKLANKDPQYGNSLPGNVCYSMVSKTTAISVTHQAYIEKNVLKVKTDLFEEADNATAIATKNWYVGITNNIFE